jgi:tetratricopeptide (TPR) repeat protein
MARKAAYAEGFDRELAERQTRRNLEGLALEADGRTDEAVALYERNIADGFEGDWPYGRLVAHYERVGRLDEAQRVLERAIEVFTASKRRTPLDRRAVLRAFKGRLKVVQKRLRDSS